MATALSGILGRGFLNLMIDTVAASLLTAMVGTGYILWFVLPPGTNRTHILWGLLRHQWGAVHVWISVMLLTVLAVHVALHWRWLVTGLSKRVGLAAWAQRSPRLAGLAVLAAAALPLTTLAIAAHVSVQLMDVPLHPLGDEPRAGAVPAIPETAAEKAAPSSSVSTPGTTSPTGPASGTSAPTMLYIRRDIATLKTLCLVSGRFWRGGRLQGQDGQREATKCPLQSQQKYAAPRGNLA